MAIPKQVDSCRVQNLHWTDSLCVQIVLDCLPELVILDFLHVSPKGARLDIGPCASLKA